MIKLNLNAHYIDEKYYIYNKFSNQENHCLKIIRDIFIESNF